MTDTSEIPGTRFIVPVNDNVIREQCIKFGRLDWDYGLLEQPEVHRSDAKLWDAMAIPA